MLSADVSEPPARWDVVATIPFGPARQALGRSVGKGSIPEEPTSFALAGDGSIWVVDAAKLRLVHYSGSGAFLGAVDRVLVRGARARNLVSAATLVYVVQDERGGILVEVRPDGSLRRIAVNEEGRNLHVTRVLWTPAGLVTAVAGYSGREQEGPNGYVAVDVARGGRATLLPGVPALGNTWLSLDRSSPTLSGGSGDQDLEFRSTARRATEVQPLHVDLIAGRGDRRTVPAEVGALDALVDRRDLLAYVQVSPSSPDDLPRYPESRWLLRMGASALLWERLPDPGVPDERQLGGHLAVGPDGAIYLMLLEKGGVRILRRP